MLDKHPDFPYVLAEVYAIRNEPDATFKWLDQAPHDRDVGVTNLLYDPLLARYQPDPRFAAFCGKAGLPVSAG